MNSDSALTRVALLDTSEVSLVEIASLQPTDTSLRNGRGIQYNEPIEVLQTSDGRRLITNGHHRAFGYYNAGETHIHARVKSPAYYDASAFFTGLDSAHYEERASIFRQQGLTHIRDLGSRLG